jgi:hypothetical protein
MHVVCPALKGLWNDPLLDSTDGLGKRPQPRFGAKASQKNRRMT